MDRARLQRLMAIVFSARAVLALPVAFALTSAHAQPTPPPTDAPDAEQPTTEQPTTEQPGASSPPSSNSSPPAPSATDSGASPTVPVGSIELPFDTASPAGHRDLGAPTRDVSEGFQFGSYGRLIAGTDLRGGKPESVNVVAHGPRIVEPSYLEIDLSYGFKTPRGLSLRPVITLAFDGTLFHDTGEFDAQPALRNMYLDAEITKTVSAWVGSRMYRGDDIYLFDYWPLDDQNTLGGGLLYRKENEHIRNDTRVHDVLEVAVHGGVNRLNHPFQFQEIDVPNPTQGATTVVQLNRQRLIASASASYLMEGPPNNISGKFKLHGELHRLPSGTRERDDGTLEELPSDNGLLVGAELSVFGWRGSHRHVNLYTRYATGLAAFDELSPPLSFGPDLKTDRASELTFGVAGNWDTGIKFTGDWSGNVMFGALTRRFIDADSIGADVDDGWEYAVDVRPLVSVLPDMFAGVDVSYQARFPRGINPNTQTAQDPAVFQIAPMLVYSPMGTSAYDRPQLRLVYRAAHLNQAALDSYVPDDPRTEHAWVHFVGVQAEWWFNSTTYR